MPEKPKSIPLLIPISELGRRGQNCPHARKRVTKADFKPDAWLKMTGEKPIPLYEENRAERLYHLIFKDQEIKWGPSR